MRAAIKDAVDFQRQLKEKEELEAAKEIQKAGGEILELTPDQMNEFVEAIKPVYSEAREKYSSELLQLVDLKF